MSVAESAAKSAKPGRPALLAVLAGGRGSRLGGEKATAPLAGRPLIEHALAAAAEAELETVVVAKPGSELPPLQVPTLIEPREPRHPLCGILAALELAAQGVPPRALLAAPGDMPFLGGALLRWLAELDGAAVLELDGVMQPLPARVSAEHRPMLVAGLAREDSLRSTLASLSPRVVREPELARFGEPRRLCFGVNRPDDLASAEAWLSGAR